MKKDMDSGTTIVLDENAAAKLAAGIKDAKIANIKEVFSRSKEIAAMRAEDVEKLARITEAGSSDGHCGIGCW